MMNRIIEIIRTIHRRKAMKLFLPGLQIEIEIERNQIYGQTKIH